MGALPRWAFYLQVGRACSALLQAIEEVGAHLVDPRSGRCPLGTQGVSRLTAGTRLT
jgi:hypothetical protein